MSTSPVFGVVKKKCYCTSRIWGVSTGKQNSSPHDYKANTLLSESQPLDTVVELSTEPRAEVSSV